MKPKVAIIGGAGFIGKSLAKHFAEKFHVKILDVKSAMDLPENLAAYINCDIRDYKEVAKGIEDVDLVIHTAIVQIPKINEAKSLGYEVNLIGTQNVCKAVENNPKIKGMILTGSWHVIGEKDLKGIIDEEFGFRPDKVEDRARLYALSKIAQESMVRYYHEMSEKIYGVIRMGTVLGENMPTEAAASVFIKKGLSGESITPFKHSMYRPMLYVDLRDICQAYETYALNIVSCRWKKSSNSLDHVFNVYYPRPITILDLAKIVQRSIIQITDGNIKPKIEILDTGVPPLFKKDDKKKIRVNVSKSRILGLDRLRSPKKSIETSLDRLFLGK